MKLKASLLLLALVLFIAPTLAPKAEAQGHHPNYLHALSDLRLARGYLYKLTPSEHIDEDQNMAVHQLEKAISEIKAASFDDGKNIDDHAPIDAHIQPRDRFARAHEALDAAMHDVEMPESDPRTRPLRQDIIDAVSRSITAVRAIQSRIH